MPQESETFASIAAPSVPRSRRTRRRPRWRRELTDWIKALALAFVIVLLLRMFVFQLSAVKMHSMEPTLYESDWIFVNKLSYYVGQPRRGDVVIFRDPRAGSGKRDMLVKRIVGVPGDMLEIRGGKLYVNGQPVVEPYTNAEIEGGDYAPVTVSADHYYVMGDNRRRGGSVDSRMFGEISENALIGRADFIVWPIARWGKL